jgi:predicted deacetylase
MNDRPRRGARALVSIHDLMPGTMDRVEELLALLGRIGVPPATLLVVPGLDWTNGQIGRLRALAAAGHELAAHGWVHRAGEVRRLDHWLHALLISRDVAEHLALEPAEIADLLTRSHGWFARNGLPAPDFYVPPAWALGRISAEALRRCPFARIETTGGVLFPASGKRLLLPLAGFEADTALRERFLRWWNRREEGRARRSGRPLRISIHPNDGRLRLAGEMEALLRKDWRFFRYGEVFPAGERKLP